MHSVALHTCVSEPTTKICIKIDPAITELLVDSCCSVWPTYRFSLRRYVQLEKLSRAIDSADGETLQQVARVRNHDQTPRNSLRHIKERSQVK